MKPLRGRGRGKFYNLNTEFEEWINKYRKLIDDACYREESVDLLIDEIRKYTDSVQERKRILEKIHNIWNDQNLYGIFALDDGRFGTYLAEHYDF